VLIPSFCIKGVDIISLLTLINTGSSMLFYRCKTELEKSATEDQTLQIFPPNHQRKNNRNEDKVHISEEGNKCINKQQTK